MMMKKTNRRNFIQTGGLLIAGSTILGSSVLAGEEKKVTPNEDLMKEHGLLNRLLLIYDEISGRIKNGEDFPPDVLNNSAAIIKNFVEDYHEKLEEKYLFPRFVDANKLTGLVQTLLNQHAGGRKLTEFILNNSNAGDIKDKENLRKINDHIKSFIKMYRPHEAREDTVLFPAFKSILTSNEYDSLGEEFEKQEHEKFGEDGFEVVLDKVSGLEKKIGIYDLSKFTPGI